VDGGPTGVLYTIGTTGHIQYEYNSSSPVWSDAYRRGILYVAGLALIDGGASLWRESRHLSEDRGRPSPSREQSNLRFGVWNTVTVTPTFRKIFAFLSACGIAASIIAYSESFAGSRADAIFRWWIVLLPAWMVVFAPIYVLEYPASRATSFAWKGFARGMPSWVAPCSWLLSLVVVAHVAWFALHSGRGVPTIQDGQFVLEARGQVLRVLTNAEYNDLRAAGARMFAAGMISFYFIPMTYWWFRRNEMRQQDTTTKS
jgi:hypothetical protein